MSVCSQVLKQTTTVLLRTALIQRIALDQGAFFLGYFKFLSVGGRPVLNQLSHWVPSGSLTCRDEPYHFYNHHQQQQHLTDYQSSLDHVHKGFPNHLPGI